MAVADEVALGPKVECVLHGGIVKIMVAEHKHDGAAMGALMILAKPFQRLVALVTIGEITSDHANVSLLRLRKSGPVPAVFVKVKMQIG